MEINWIELEKSQICNRDDVTLFDEVISCYKNKLYRSGYLLAWILLVESLKRKIIQLASLEDARGKAQWKLIEQLEKDHLSADCQIVLSANECEIISDAEISTINYLWQQRCIFAHPYMQEVNAADLEYIIFKMVDITLSKPLSFSKKMIEEKLEELVNHPYIIPSNIDEQRKYINQLLILIKEKHYPALYKNLFYHLSKSLENNNTIVSVFMKRFISILLNNIDINQPEFTLAKQISNYPLVCWKIFNIPDNWNKLEIKFQGDLFRYLQLSTNDILPDVIINAYNIISKGANIENDFLNIYYEKLKDFSILVSYTLYVDKSILLQRIYDEYIKDNQFAKQMKYVDFLENLNHKISDIFDDNESKILGDYLGKCCITNTFTALGFANKCGDFWINNMSFCTGFIDSVMSKDGNLYIYCNCLKSVLNVLSKLDTNNFDKIFNILESLPNNLASSDEYFYDRTINIFNENKHLFSDDLLSNRIMALVNKFYQPVIDNK